jgi:hypothetical protein
MAKKKVPKSPATNDYFYPTLCALVDRPAASAIDSLAHYVRPRGDYILTRSMLDEIDRALGEVELILRHKWNGQCWSKR